MLYTFFCSYTCLSVSLDTFLLGSRVRPSQRKVISDASPWRLAAGLYDFESGQLICWTTLMLPYSSMHAERYQTHREYLGHLLSVLLISLTSLDCPRQWKRRLINGLTIIPVLLHGQTNTSVVPWPACLRAWQSAKSTYLRTSGPRRRPTFPVPPWVKST